jgi:hypothetical protein
MRVSEDDNECRYYLITHESLRGRFETNLKQFELSSPVDARIAFSDHGEYIEFGDTSQSMSDVGNLGKFLSLCCELNTLAFDQAGLGMPQWVLLNLALAPSALLVAAVQPGKLRSIARRQADPRRWKLEALLDRAIACDHAGRVPIAAYCAAPTAEPSRWFGWSASSLLEHQGFILKGLALGAYRPTVLNGIAQYGDAAALKMHVKFGPMRIRNPSLLGVHELPGSFFYEWIPYYATVPSLGTLVEDARTDPARDSRSPRQSSLIDWSAIIADPAFRVRMEREIHSSAAVYYVVPESWCDDTLMSPVPPIYKIW